MTQFAYLYGHEPVLDLGATDDGTDRHEVIRLGSLIEYHPTSDLNFGDRGPVPTGTPSPPSDDSGDRIDKLEKQMTKLVEALGNLVPGSKDEDKATVSTPAPEPETEPQQ